MDSQITLQASKLNQPLAKLDGQVSVVLRQNVIGDKFKEFEAAVKVGQ